MLWVRGDLRFHDNECLSYLSSLPSTTLCVPVFVFDPRHLSAHTPIRGRLPAAGLGRCSPARLAFLHQAVGEFADRLRGLGSRLHVAVGRAEDVLAAIARQVGATRIVCSREFAWDEQLVEEAVEKEIKALGGDLVRFNTALSVRIEDLPGGVQGLPTSFSKYFRGIVGKLKPVQPLQAPARLPPPPPSFSPASLSLKEVADALGHPELADAPPRDPRSAVPDLPGGETGALSRLSDYFSSPGAFKYDKTRNGMIGQAYSTKFSPWLAQGSLSARSVMERVNQLQARAPHAAQQLALEIAWRDYFKLLALKTGASFFYWAGLRGQTPKPITLPADEQRARFERWCQGRTGNAFVDAQMREIAHTGFMSNRGRQNVASFLIYDLGLDWRWGAGYFDFILIDADPALNHGNWKYIAGTGMRSEDTAFDVEQQRQRYDPQGTHAKLWLQD